MSGDDSAYCNSSSNDSKRVYDREAVAEYAAIYAGGNLQGINNMLEGFLGFLGIVRNDYYPSFQHNCTNFTSQAISAGGCRKIVIGMLAGAGIIGSILTVGPLQVINLTILHTVIITIIHTK